MVLNSVNKAKLRCKVISAPGWIETAETAERHTSARSTSKSKKATGETKKERTRKMLVNLEQLCLLIGAGRDVCLLLDSAWVDTGENEGGFESELSLKLQDKGVAKSHVLRLKNREHPGREVTGGPAEEIDGTAWN